MRRYALVLAAALAGCSSPDLPTLPDQPGPAAEPPVTEGGITVAASDPDALRPAVAGEEILPGVVLLEPQLDAAAGVASFAVRNDSGRDLPDLILSVVFAVPPAPGEDGTSKGPVRPRFESIEAPMKAGEVRRLRATLASALPGETAGSFRVVAGLPELLTARGEGLPGTTFLGGLLECVSLDADLTGVRRLVTVGLSARGEAALPALEAQLLIGRAGDLQWTGPWILVPNAGRDGAGERRIQWNLDGAPGLAACDLFLRVREKR